VAVLLVGLAAAADAPKTASVQAPPILPQQFGGWQMQGAPRTSKDSAAADPANAAVLHEFGLTDFESSTYKSDDGRTLKIRAARFADASGAVGAYLFYLQPGMAREQIGEKGVSVNDRVLFYRGNVVVDAQFSQVSAMSAAALRELAGVLPRPVGNAANPPPILERMPERGFVPNTEKYAAGPLTLGAISSPLAANLVDFAASAEVALGQYSVSGGQATLLLIEYPTPQIAAEHLRRIDAANHAAQPQAGVAAIENVGAFFDKRTGPVVAIVAGAPSESGARDLLGSVNYEASVTWNQNTYFDKKNNVANLLVNAILLCMVLGAISLAAGVAFGGMRVLLQRLLPGKIFHRPERAEFISLHLEETAAQASSPGSQGASSALNGS
jgi:hypothetical protein